MTNERIESRNSAFELLRIVSMFMIILHHFVCHGIFNNPMLPKNFMQDSNLNLFFAWLYFPGGEVGVALFFMITGFFCINSHKIRIVKVVLQVVFYSWFSLALYFILKHLEYDFAQSFTLELEKKLIFDCLIFPIRSGLFWFATAYAFLRLIIPVYNSFLEKLNKDGFLAVLLLLYLALISSQLFTVVLGYTKAIFYYSIGGFIRNYVLKDKNNGGRYKSIIVFLLSWLSYALVRFYVSDLQVTGVIKFLMVLFNNLFPSCILVPICAVSFFCFFAKMKMRDSKIINIVSATTFGVYLLHDSIIIRTFLWCKIVKVQVLYLSYLFPLYGIIITMLIFAFCSLFDLMRIVFIESFVLKIVDKISVKLKTKFEDNLC